ncbi:hypothetical protein [Guggenheimella bovis]
MNTLHAGVLKKHKTDFQVVRLDLENVQEVIEMQIRIHEGMTRKDWFVEDTADEMRHALKNGGALFGVYNDKKDLIASRFISVPRTDESNLAHDIKLPLDLNQVVQLESTVVDPKYRGNRLQGITLMVAERFARLKGYEHLVCSVAPTNIFSLYNIMKGGLEIKALKKKYQSKTEDGVWRFILHKDLKEAPIKEFRKYFDVDFDALDIQSLLIEKGFVGMNVSRRKRKISYVL